jgi:protein-tyrosine phosphatase
MQADRIRVLFVCLGNICRSPLAEVIVRAAAVRRGLAHYHFESAGTGDWHIGGPADPRSAAKAREYGLDLGAHRAQQVTALNCGNWDWLVAMDADNRRQLLQMGADASCILMMRQFERGGAESGNVIADVPDPYYGGPDGFEHAYRMLAANAEALLDYLESRRYENVG